MIIKNIQTAFNKPNSFFRKRIINIIIMVMMMMMMMYSAVHSTGATASNQVSLGSGHPSNQRTFLGIFAVPSNAVFCTCPGLTLTCIYIIRNEETQPTQNAV